MFGHRGAPAVGRPPRATLWGRAAHADHRTRQRRQGRRRAGAPARAAATADPLLVVPTSADVDHYRRELAPAGIVFGAEVVTFRRLVRDARGGGRRPRAAARAGWRASAWCAPRCADARLRVLAASAAAPGFAAAAGRAVRRAPAHARHARALHARAARRGRRPAPRPPTPRSSRRSTRPTTGGWSGSARATRRATRARRWTRCASGPAAWGARPVLLYGFDDLTPLQLDAVETLSGRAGAEVCVALPYEAGPGGVRRPRGDGRAAEAAGRAPRRAARTARSTTRRARGARCTTWSGGCSRRGAARVSPNGAVRLLEAGGERAEAELVAAEVLELMREGVAAEDVAVLVRGGERAVAVLADRARRLRRAGRARRAGAAGAARGSAPACSRSPAPRCPAGTAARRAALAADAGQARRPRRRRRAGGARAPRRGRHGRRRAPAVGAASDPRAELAALAEARRGRRRSRCSRRCSPRRRRSGPRRTARRAAVLGPEDAADARAAGALRSARAASCARSPPPTRSCWATPADVLEALAAVEVREPAGARGVLVADALAIRARRFRAVFVCGLQDGEFPRRPHARAVPRRRRPRRRSRAPPGSCCAATRTCWARSATSSTPASRAPRRCCSSPSAAPTRRATRRSRRRSSTTSRALFTDELWEQRGTRLLAEVTWPPATAPTPHELRRAQAAAERAPEPRAARRARRPPRCSPRSPRAGRSRRARLETFAACGVRWLVESVLKPEPDRARPGADAPRLARPRRARADAAAAARSARARRGWRRTRSTPRWRSCAGRSASCASWRPRLATRARAALRALEEDLARYLRHEAETGAGLEPRVARVELRRARATSTARSRSTARASRSTGRVDRIDVDGGGRAVVRDYKGKHRARRARAGRQDGRLQAALYALAARELLGLEPAGALYQPIGQRRPPPARARARRASPGRYVNGDVVEPEALDAALRRGARAPRSDAARAMHAGAIRPCPSRCSPNGCAYPGICRAAEERRRTLPALSRAALHRRAARRDRGPRRLGAARRQRRLGQDGRDGRALRRGGAASTASPVGAILALTFTEKAAGELRERVRRRLVELGEDEHARAVDGAWIGTIHGFCARVLRARPLAAGPGPALRRCSTRPPRGRLAARRLRARARGVGGRRTGAPAVDLAAAYGASLRDLVLGAHDDAAQPRRRSRGCRSRPSARRRRRARARPPRARGRGRRARAGAGDGHPRAARGAAALDGLRAAARPAARRAAPGDLDAGQARRGGEGARHRGAARPTATAWEAYRRGLRRPPRARRRSCCSTTLLAPLRRRVRGGQGRARGASTSRTSSSACATCSPTTRERRRWSERFALIMVDEFQDTNRLQLDLLEALERDNLFAVGDEFQSIYRFRHADVEIFRERRAQLGAARVRGLRGQLPLGARAARRAQRRLRARVRRRLPAARRRPPARGGAGRGRRRRAAAVRPRPARAATPPVELLVTDTQGLGRARAAARARRARRAAVAARRGAAASPTGCARRSRRPPPGRHRRARARDRLAAAVRAGARGAGPAHVRRRRPRLLVAGAGPRRRSPTSPRSPTRATRPPFYGVLASPFCGAGSDALVLLAQAGREGARGPWAALRDAAGADRRRRPRRVARRRPGRRPRPLLAFARLLRRRARARRAAARRRRCSSARSPRPATTSRSSPARAASGGWRTCAS